MNCCKARQRKECFPCRCFCWHKRHTALYHKQRPARHIRLPVSEKLGGGGDEVSGLHVVGYTERLFLPS